MKGAESLRDQTGSGHSSSQTLSPSLDACAQLCPSQAPPLTLLEACTETFRHSGGRASEARVDNRVSERGLGGFNGFLHYLALGALVTQAGPGTLRVHQRLCVGCWSARMQNHTLAWRCSCILHPPGLPGGKRQCGGGGGKHLSTYSGEGKSCPMVGQNLQVKKGNLCKSICVLLHQHLHPPSQPTPSICRIQGSGAPSLGMN